MPLYLHTHYAIQTDPLAMGINRVSFERDAVVMAVQMWGNRHGRYYDPAHLSSRILKCCDNLGCSSIIRIGNLNEIGGSYMHVLR